MHVDLRHFRAFLAVVRLGSFTRAASHLHVSQPALTVQIRQLEQALGLRLFDRNNRRVLLTQPGQQLVAPVERLISEFDGLVRDAGDLAMEHRHGPRPGRVARIAGHREEFGCVAVGDRPPVLRADTAS